MMNDGKIGKNGGNDGKNRSTKKRIVSGGISSSKWEEVAG